MAARDCSPYHLIRRWATRAESVQSSHSHRSAHTISILKSTHMYKREACLPPVWEVLRCSSRQSLVLV